MLYILKTTRNIVYLCPWISARLYRI